MTLYSSFPEAEYDTGAEMPLIYGRAASRSKGIRGSEGGRRNS